MAITASSPSTTNTESFVSRHAWKVLLALSLLIGFFGLMDLAGGAADLQNGEAVLMHSLTGMSWTELQAASPAAAHLVDWKFRSDGATLLVLGVLASAVCLGGFRQRQRWAWYALWAVPGWVALTVISLLSAVAYPGYGTPVPMVSGSIIFVVWSAALGLTWRSFWGS
jgi:hypothetical protein